MEAKEMCKLIERLLDAAEDGNGEALTDAFELTRELEVSGAVLADRSDRGYERLIPSDTCFKAAHKYAARIRYLANQRLKAMGLAADAELYRRVLLFEAPYDFDAYCLYLEWDREPQKKFYVPRRKQLLPIVAALQDLADGKLDVLGISMPPGTGKTTLAEFFLSWLAGKDPIKPILTGSHNVAFLSGLYGEMLRILSPNGEYRWCDVFPAYSVVNTNARDMMIDVARSKKNRKRFATLEFTSIGSGNAGKVRAVNLLYCDDLVDGIETALSIERLDKLWQQYYTDLRQRKQGDCKELHIATRWSTRDIIGRLEVEYEGNERARFIRFPALDTDGNSNFDYPYGLGFTTKMYQEQRNIMDDASWRALYCNEPIEREGQLYAGDELRHYFQLPEREPDARIAVCDIADGGGDYWCMPIAYQYGNDYYIVEIICDNGKPNIVESRIVEALIRHKVQAARFESNRAGGRVAESVQAKIKEQGGITRITTKWNQTQKETRIIMASGYAKDMFLFKDSSLYQTDREYRSAITFLTSYTMAGKNKNDDVPDAIAQLVDFVQSISTPTIQIMKRPF